MNYQLRDVEQDFLKGSFSSVPPPETLKALKPGQSVKLIFINPEGGEPSGERMWVEVERTVGKGFVGFMRSNPGAIRGLKWGDEVRFEARHVCDVWHEA